MSGFKLSLVRRRRCEASGKEYTRYMRRGQPIGQGRPSSGQLTDALRARLDRFAVTN